MIDTSAGPYNEPPLQPVAPTLLWSEAEYTQLVNATLRQVHSVLALARSPLADSPLVTPLLVLDDVSPTADERGQALRLLLQWAVDQLAPGRPTYPLGAYRPPDDPTWRDSRWWRYNILRHRYLEPLHPDEFVEGGRFTETLLALTGIPSADTFFDERNRAIREVAQWLRQQAQTGQADAELRDLALAAAARPLDNQPNAAALLAIAAAFDDVFPRSLLLQMAAAEHLPDAEPALVHLIQHRFLLSGDEEQNLWLSPVLRRYVYLRQTKLDLAARHRRIAAYFLAEDNPLAAARHLQAAQRWDAAADLLLTAADELVNELHADDLLRGLEAFKRNHLAADQWREVQILRADLYRQRGRHNDALVACRAALRAADVPVDQARVYRRMGKLYEKHNQLHALGYYQQAAERFPTDAPELVVLLKDRAWLYILRQEWTAAEADLTRALALVAAEASDLRADIYDALASLARHLRRYPAAIDHGRAALALREETGDLLRVANSFNNLGLVYNDMGDYRHAIAAFREAQATYATLGNRELAAGSLLNIGLAHHLDGRLDEAIRAYRDCLARCQAIGLPLVEARAHANLVEALAGQGDIDAARRHWEAGLALSRQAGFDDEIAYYQELAGQFPALNAAGPPAPNPVPLPPADAPESPVDSDLATIVDLARREGRVTPRRLMEALAVSKATATRRLADLVAQGALVRQGSGRGAYYEPATLVHAEPNPDAAVETVAALRAQLDRHWEPLRQSYALTGLGVVTTAPGSQRLVARFAAPPDLPDFFKLEAALTRLLNREIDLLPESVVPARTGQEPAQTIAWVWS